MTIPAHKIPDYIPSLSFPIPVFRERMQDVAFVIQNPIQLLANVNAETIIATGTRSRLRRFEAVNRIRIHPQEAPTKEKSGIPIAEDNRTSVLAGVTWMHHVKRCNAYSPELRQESR